MSTVPTLERLRALLFTAVAVSIVHYADNTLRWDDFVPADPDDLTFSFIQRWTIPTAWVAFTVCAFLADRAFRQRRWSAAAAWLGAYSGSGLIGFGHYLDISPSQLSGFQNAHVLVDGMLGVLLLGFAIWIVVSIPSLPRSTEVAPDVPAPV